MIVNDIDDDVLFPILLVLKMETNISLHKWRWLYYYYYSMAFWWPYWLTLIIGKADDMTMMTDK